MSDVLRGQNSVKFSPDLGKSRKDLCYCFVTAIFGLLQLARGMEKKKATSRA